MSKLDDLFDKKKDEAPILDLSKETINTPEEYRAVLDKVPDFKTRPEKVNSYFLVTFFKKTCLENIQFNNYIILLISN